MFSGYQERFKAMDSRSRSGLIEEAMKRHDLYFRSVAPRSKNHILRLVAGEQGLPISTAQDAQQAVALELYYACIYDLLKIQDHELQSLKFQGREIPELVRGLPQKADRLNAVLQGDWTLAKERWNEGLSNLWRRRGRTRYRLSDRLRVNQDLFDRDIPSITRALNLIQDQTGPVNIAVLDPNRPILA